MNETIACRLTAPIPAALATIAVAGPDARRIVQSCTASTWRSRKTGASGFSRIALVRWPVLDGMVSEEVVVCQVNDKTVELHCHGGIAVSNAILENLQRAGCQIVDQMIWANRCDASHTSNWLSVLSNAVDRLLIEVTSDRCLGILLDQKAGALASRLQSIVQLAHSQQLESARQLISELLKWQSIGNHLTQPWSVVLAGPPNVGKSSLMNAMSGKPQAIVHAEAGTTRDWIDIDIEIDGWSVRLTDTAGIHPAARGIEGEGVVRAKERILSADLVVIVVDITVGWTLEHQSIVEFCQQAHRSPKILIAFNKWDLDSTANMRLSPDENSVCCSARSGVEPLLEAILKALVPEAPTPGTAVPFSDGLCRVLSQWKERLYHSDYQIDLNDLLLTDVFLTSSGQANNASSSTPSHSLKIS